MTNGGQFLISRIITPLTGLIGVPALLGTGRRLGFMIHQIMSYGIHFSGLCRITAGTVPFLDPLVLTCWSSRLSPIIPVMTQDRCLICLIAVAAAGADKGGISRFRTGRGSNLRLIIMTQCLNFLTGGKVAADAGLIGVPAFLSTGRCLGFMIHQSMSYGIHFSGLFQVAALTDPRLNTAFRTGRLRRHFPILPAVTKGSNILCLPAQLLSADGAVYDLVITSLFCTCRGNLIFPDRLARLMTNGGQFLISRIVAARAGLIGVPALLRTGWRFGFMVNHFMPKGCNFAGFFRITTRTASCPDSAFCTRGCFRYVPVAPVMTKRSDFLIS